MCRTQTAQREPSDITKENQMSKATTIDAGNGILVEIAPVPKTASKKPTAKKPLKVAVDGSKRGVAKAANWKPETKSSSFAEIKERTGASGLRVPQANILTTLAKAKAPMTRAKIAELTGIDQSWVGDWIGYATVEQRAEQERKWGRTALITLKFVKQTITLVDDREVTVYEITPTGRKELDVYTQMLRDKETAKKAAEKEKATRAKERAKTKSVKKAKE